MDGRTTAEPTRVTANLRELAASLRAPRLSVGEAARLGSSLPWRLVAEASTDSRVTPSVRSALDDALAERAPALTVGERIALARLAGPRTRDALRADADVRVLTALRENPRATAAEIAGVRYVLAARALGDSLDEGPKEAP
jgi:hypothetical protein